MAMATESHIGCYLENVAVFVQNTHGKKRFVLIKPVL